MARKAIPTSDALVSKKKYWGAQDAERYLTAWRETGGSLSAFARQHGLDPRRLMRWRRRLAADDTIRFHRVRVVSASKSEGSPESTLELVLRDGRGIRIGRGFDAALLEELVRTVESWTC